MSHHTNTHQAITNIIDSTPLHSTPLHSCLSLYSSINKINTEKNLKRESVKQKLFRSPNTLLKSRLFRHLFTPPLTLLSLFLSSFQIGKSPIHFQASTPLTPILSHPYISYSSPPIPLPLFVMKRS